VNFKQIDYLADSLVLNPGKVEEEKDLNKVTPIT